MKHTTGIFPYQFSALDYDQQSRFDAWRSEHRHHDISRGMRDVIIHDASFLGTHLDDLMLGQWHFCAQCAHGIDRQAYRTRQKIRRDGLDHFYLRLSLTEAWCMSVNDETLLVEPGQLALVDLGQPYDLSIASGDVLMLMVPRDNLPAVTANLHGTVLSHALGQLFADYLRALFFRLGDWRTEEYPSVAEATLNFLSASLSGDSDIREAVHREIDETLLSKVRRHIDCNLDNQALSVNDICAHVGLSRSRLYRLFEPAGGIANYIRRRRLTKVYRILQAHVGPKPLISDLAFRFGFSSPDQLARAFKRRYGFAPRDLANDALSSGVSPSARFTGIWLQPR
ncbi:helix-turn-helix domain-containing protein [Kosakonia sp. S42]|uniref:helix-turn-helix domain-containing protein n=1 Tax=Kosakonia sp. S42 TaxID=2767458 RepID=UPI00190E5CD5|nr:helix-turn-helix domain-containing protein [Kosakonia sp. S42]MBK0018751.1 helix-turn-helix domain-containing protein [Kosakonia sp. S42]